MIISFINTIKIENRVGVVMIFFIFILKNFY
jgi:hypothetical protein